MDLLLFLADANSKKAVTFGQWLENNPLVIVLVLTVVLILIAQLVRPMLEPTEEAEPPPEPKLPPKAKAARAREEAKEPVKVPVEEPEEVEAEEGPAKEPEVAEPVVEPKKKKKKKKKKKEPVVEEAPLAEPVPEEKEEHKEEVEEEVKEAKEEVEEERKEEVKEEVEEVKEEPKVKKKPAVKKEELTAEEEARRERFEKLQEKRKKTVGDLDIQEDEVQPRTLREGLEATRKGWISRLTELVRGKKELDDEMLEELEEVLYQADIGTRTTVKLVQVIEEKMERNELSDPELVKEALKDEIYKILTFEADELDFDRENPFVVMVVGVNGVGKTTTIGKLAARLSHQGKKVVVAAADTFRAAAVEQLEQWASRVDADVIKGQPNQDPSSVVFDAVKAGDARGADVILADTAGRLHTKQNLMEELKKVKRVMGRALASAPHEIILVVDATTGQNAVNQAKQFHEALGLTGIVLTKLDGTAKGGVVVAIAEELKIPIRYIGVGEHIDELRRFSASEFVDALF